MSKVYVVLSESIAQSYSSHGLHGVYATKYDAQVTAMSTIMSIARRHGHEVTGETTFHSIFEFNRLKESIEEGGKGYSIRECVNKHGYCETYKVVNNYGMDKV